ncbi:hypothetical protein Acr_24g0006770 [Actinidia rufa]|uniref:Uncharacterized protein n=1 Tax=Actinidia rufa TaxID=165716 RepID=A0A7J0GUG9_9ERIC|nr:hypothetical protein Acr_24g0006770 [Actinidia rufa]
MSLQSKKFSNLSPSLGGSESSGGDNAEDKLIGNVAPVMGDEGESHHSQDDPRRGVNSRDDSIEYIGIIRRRERKVLPRHLDQIFLIRTIAGPRAQIGWIILKKLVWLVEGSRSATPEVRSTPVAKMVAIGEKCPHVKMPDISPSKKGKLLGQ